LHQILGALDRFLPSEFRSLTNSLNNRELVLPKTYVKYLVDWTPRSLIWY